MYYKVEHYPNGNIKRIEVKNDRGDFHNEYGPAIQAWHENGQEAYRSYLLNSNRHNESGPAIQAWHPNGQERLRAYCLNGKLHNDNGPARQAWYEDEKEHYREYWTNGVLHNDNGAAHQKWNKDGQERIREYFLNGKQLTEGEFSMRTFSIQIDYKTHVASKSFSTNLSDDYNKDDVVSAAVNKGVISPDDMEYVIGFVELDQ